MVGGRGFCLGGGTSLLSHHMGLWTPRISIITQFQTLVGILETKSQNMDVVSDRCLHYISDNSKVVSYSKHWDSQDFYQKLDPKPISRISMTKTFQKWHASPNHLIVEYPFRGWV